MESGKWSRKKIKNKIKNMEICREKIITRNEIHIIGFWFKNKLITIIINNNYDDLL